MAVLYAQLVHAISLNDVCDALRLHAAKMHLRLNLGSFLPAFAVVDTAKLTDAKAAPAVCAGIGRCEIV